MGTMCVCGHVRADHKHYRHSKECGNCMCSGWRPRWLFFWRLWHLDD